MNLHIYSVITSLLFTSVITYGAKPMPFDYGENRVAYSSYADSTDFSSYYEQYLLHPDFPDWQSTKDLTEEFQGFEIDTQDLFSTYLDGNEHIQNGIFGPNYHRLQIYISNICKQVSANKFKILGADKRADEIYFFTGYLTIDHLFRYQYDTKESDNPEYVLTGHYDINEDDPSTGSGTFKGIFGIYVKVSVQYDALKDVLRRKIIIDADNGVADNYNNRNYVGTWTSHSTGSTLKAIWGDSRLPYTFDFDCGAGEMAPCDKYIDEGWESYLKGDEYTEVKDDEGTITGYELKHKWWK